MTTDISKVLEIQRYLGRFSDIFSYAYEELFVGSMIFILMLLIIVCIAVHGTELR
jgi:hypothetical protein